MNALQEIKARAEAATEGPWLAMTEETGDGENIYYTVEAKSATPGDYLLDISDTGVHGRADAEFIAHAREDVPRLIAALESVEALAEFWQTMAPGDQHYAQRLRTAIDKALEDDK